MRVELFSAKALRAALIEAGVKGVPGERQVRNWVSSGHVPRSFERDVEALLPTQKEPPEPAWVGRLEAKLDQVVANQPNIAKEAVRQLVSALAPPGRLADVESIADELRRAPQPSSEDAHDSPGAEGQDIREQEVRGSA